jgi:hypothetical protein
MHSVIALAGFAEMALASTVTQIYVGLLVAAVVFGIALWRRSILISVATILPIYAVGYLADPLSSCFWVPNPIDPDQEYWSSRCRMAGLLLILFCLLSLALVIFQINRRIKAHRNAN